MNSALKYLERKSPRPPVPCMSDHPEILARLFTRPVKTNKRRPWWVRLGRKFKRKSNPETK